MRTFRVFVSSTFEDFVEERNILQGKVFPALTALCHARGAQFQAVDLRWGVSDQAGADHRAIDICLAEILRCQAVSPRPNFLILLGDRYGWCPPPTRITAAVFDDLASRLDTAADRELLEEWYGRDDNAVPPERYLRPRVGAMREHAAWQPTETRLRAILESVVVGTQWASDPRFVGSATEQEIVAGALTVPDARDHVFCFMRTSGTDDERVLRLKARLRAALPTAVLNLDDFAEDVIAALTRVIESELDRVDDGDALVEELARHDEFGADRASDFTGRALDLERIAAYLETNLHGAQPHPYVVHGASGAGKSALIARAAIDARRVHPHAATVARFLGCTPESTVGRDLLHGLCRQVTQAYSHPTQLDSDVRRERLDEDTIPNDYNDLVSEFSRRLELASAERPLHIFVDALDQLPETDPAQRLAWLPSQLPEHVRMVVSTTPATIAYRTLQGRLPPQQFVALDRMDHLDGKQLLEVWLQRAGRTLTPAQQAYVIDRFEMEGLPLYLKLAFEQARRWRSDQQPQLAIGIRGVITSNLLARLAAEEEHGATLVGHALGYLAGARNGLSEDELLDLLSADPDVIADFRCRSPRSPVVDRLPPIVWSRLYADVEPYLTERAADGARLLTFYHRQLREVVEEQYLVGDVALQRHTGLAEYFSDDTAQPLMYGTAANRRRLTELPYQQTEAGLTDAITATLTDVDFLTAKARYGGGAPSGRGDHPNELVHRGVHQLQADFAFALGRLPNLDGVVEAFSDALDREAHILVAAPELCFQQLYNQLQWNGGLAADLIQRQRSRQQRPFMHVLTKARDSSALRRTMTVDVSYVSRVEAIPNSELIVTAGYDAHLKIWDRRTGELQTVLVGHTNSVENCKPTPDGRRLISLGQDATIRIWDLDTGTLIHTLPGSNSPAVGTYDCAVSPDGRFLLVAGRPGSGALFVWGIDDGVLVSSLDGHAEAREGWAIAPDASTVTLLYRDGRLLVWSLVDGAVIAASNTRHNFDVMPSVFDETPIIAYGAGGATVVTQTPAPRVECFDSLTLQRLWTREGQLLDVDGDGTVYVRRNDGVLVLDGDGEVVETWPPCPFGKLSPDRTMLVERSPTELTVWDTKSGVRRGDLVGHGGQIQNSVFTDDGLMATSCDDGTVRIWDLARLRTDDHVGYAKYIADTRVSPDGSVVASVGKQVQIWSTADGSLLHSLDAHTDPSSVLFTSEHGDFVTEDHREIALWRGRDRELIGRMLKRSFKPDRGNLLLASTEDRWFIVSFSDYLWIVNAVRATELAKVPTESRVTLAVLTSDRRHLVGLRDDGVLHIFSTDDWSCRMSVAVAPPGTERIGPLVLSPDASRVLTGGVEGMICVRDMWTGTQVRVLKHPDPVVHCDYLPDGSAIVTTTSDGSIWVWDPVEIAPARLLARTAAPVHFLVVSPDGRFVITAGNDRWISMREIATGSEVASLRSPGWVTSFDIHSWRPFLTCGDMAGNVSLIDIVGLGYGPIVVTARELAGQRGLFARCPRCRREHEVDISKLGSEYRCPTTTCGLPLRVNSFSSTSLPAASYADAEPVTEPIPLVTSGFRTRCADVLPGSVWSGSYLGTDQTWLFNEDGTVTVGDERPDGMWLPFDDRAVVYQGGFEIMISVRVDADTLDCSIGRLGDTETTWIPFTLHRVRR